MNDLQATVLGAIIGNSIFLIFHKPIIKVLEKIVDKLT